MVLSQNRCVSQGVGEFVRLTNSAFLAERLRRPGSLLRLLAGEGRSADTFPPPIEPAYCHDDQCG